ncbi:hypothetical protein Sango_0017600 [Sesamum angolense]|uniref:hAT-like transposase RNase-H fold domain-containing protein n=1 Tax=Sesamum angolense TaxID=2727404 RepID=A0AAE2C575_9LAMI|nr:hypothetical protein Sango_0017600 [Sesamum angolense]
MLLQEQMVSKDIAISRMTKDMKSKFDKYWNCYSTVLTFAIVLDPQYKLEFVEFCYKKLDVSTSYDKVNVLRELMRELFEEYLRRPFRYLGGVLRAQGLPWRGLIFRLESSGTIYGNHEKRLLIRDGKNIKKRLVQQSRRGYAKAEKLNGIVNKK